MIAAYACLAWVVVSLVLSPAIARALFGRRFK